MDDKRMNENTSKAKQSDMLFLWSQTRSRKYADVDIEVVHTKNIGHRYFDFIFRFLSKGYF